MIDFNVIKTKSGKEIYATDLTKLTQGIDPDPNSGSYLCVCPVCQYNHAKGIDGYSYDPNYRKRKLSVDANREVAYCYRAQHAFIDCSDRIIVNLARINPLMQEDVTLIKLANIEDHTDNIRRLTPKHIKYLKDRNPMIDPDLFGIKSFEFWDDRPNVFIPTYWNNELIYYQLRFMDDDIPKYYLPSILRKPLYIPKCKSLDCSKIVICEGVFDAIACYYLYPDRIPVAVFGSDINKYQLGLLRSSIMVDDILIYMDDTSKSKKIKNRLEHSALANYVSKIEIRESDGEDPEEYLRSNYEHLCER